MGFSAVLQVGGEEEDMEWKGNEDDGREGGDMEEERAVGSGGKGSGFKRLLRSISGPLQVGEINNDTPACDARQ